MPWTIYNTLMKIESTFHTLKTELYLQSIYQKTDKASMAHLHHGLLAYWVVNTTRHQLKQKEISNEWKDIVRIMDNQKIGTTTMENDCHQPLVICQFNEPAVQVNPLNTALK